jgi:iron complex outermembrane receptor protein
MVSGTFRSLVSVAPWLAPAALACLLAAGHPSIALAQRSVSPLKRLSLEELMEIDVTSVSRRPERIATAAAAIQVITAEDLRRSGVTTLIQALRLASGLIVARQNNAGGIVSARGFASPASNKMLVLIDGRSIYTPLFSGVFWEVQDVKLSDVERIEVIRGPGAALWGSNAVNGMIQVITRNAADTRGTHATLVIGQEEPGTAAARHGGSLGAHGAYRVYGKYGYRDDQKRPDGSDANDPQRHGQGGFRADWNFDDRRSVTLQGDLYSGRYGLNDSRTIEAWGGNLLGRWTQRTGRSSELSVQGYYDRTHRLVPRQFTEDRDTWDLDVQHRLSVARRHDVLWGGGYRFSDDETEAGTVGFDPASRGVSLWSVFAQDEIAVLPERAWLMGGLRLEHNAYTGWETQPTVRVRVMPARTQTVWAAVSRAVRIPTRLDVDSRLRAGPDTPVLVFGNPEFRSEKAVSGELGYRVRPHRMVSVDVATYLTRYRDLRSQERIGAAPFPIRIGNGFRGRTAGGEVIVQLAPLRSARFELAYSYLNKSLEREPGSTDLSGGVAEGNDPTHQGFLRWSVDLAPDWELDGAIRAVGALPDPRVPAYAALDFRLGWHATPHLQVALVGRDLPSARHPEFGPVGIRDEFERSVYLRLVFDF